MDAPERLSDHLAEVRDQAMAVITANLGAATPYTLRFADLPDLATVQVLIALEEQFGIPLDVDDVLPDGTVSSLCDLVRIRVIVGRWAGKAHFGEPSNLIDLADYRRGLPVDRRKMLRPQPAIIFHSPLCETFVEREAAPVSPSMKILDGARPFQPGERLTAKVQDEWPKDRARRARLKALFLTAIGLAGLILVGLFERRRR